ncbi:hypothetical protein BRD11_06110 [Halobacteriales archaeon SW_12_69_24]|nr:MAG: hypothetical protein BRD11_06110 [Halobacteriales archaeon SW_12_69_24]
MRSDALAGHHRPDPVSGRGRFRRRTRHRIPPPHSPPPHRRRVFSPALLPGRDVRLDHHRRRDSGPGRLRCRSHRRQPD